MSPRSRSLGIAPDLTVAAGVPATSRRGFLLGAAGLTTGAALTLAGCGSSDSDDASDSSSGTAAATAAGSGSFPVTVAGRPGPVTVKSAPKRVVAYGYGRDTDIALALDAPLVLATRNTGFPDGASPWAKPGAGVTLVSNTDGLPLEKIAGASPDLILASDDYALADDFGKLSSLAPTLGVKSGVSKDTWDVMTQRAGEVLGKQTKANQLIADVKAQITKAGQDHPELQGKTFTFGPVTAGQVYTINSATDASAVFFNQLGLKLAPQVTSLPASSTPGRAQVSMERLDLLEADVLILTFPDPSDQASFEKGALFKQLKAVQRGSYVALDFTTAFAIAFPSVLSIPYGLNDSVPLLAAAAANV